MLHTKPNTQNDPLVANASLSPLAQHGPTLHDSEHGLLVTQEFSYIRLVEHDDPARVEFSRIER